MTRGSRRCTLPDPTWTILWEETCSRRWWCKSESVRTTRMARIRMFGGFKFLHATTRIMAKQGRRRGQSRVHRPKPRDPTRKPRLELSGSNLPRGWKIRKFDRRRMTIDEFDRRMRLNMGSVSIERPGPGRIARVWQKWVK